MRRAKDEIPYDPHDARWLRRRAAYERLEGIKRARRRAGQKPRTGANSGGHRPQPPESPMAG